MYRSTRQMRLSLAFLMGLAGFLGQFPVFAETADSQESPAHHAQNHLDWPGIYNGFLPCDDCRGVKTTLALNKNNSYILITQNVGKSDREIVEKGKFVWSGNNDSIVLTPRNSTTNRYYAVAKDALIKLDDNGNRISGKLAEKYVLKRTDVTNDAPSHAGH